MYNILISQDLTQSYLTNTSFERHLEHEEVLKDKIKITYVNAIQSLCVLSQKQELRKYFNGYEKYKNKTIKQNRHILISAMVDKEEGIIYLIVKNKKNACMSLKSYDPATDELTTISRKLQRNESDSRYDVFNMKRKYFYISISSNSTSQTIKEIWQNSNIDITVYNYEEKLENIDGKITLTNPLDANGFPVENIFSENFCAPRVGRKFSSIMKINNIHPKKKLENSLLLIDKKNASLSVILPEDFEEGIPLYFRGRQLKGARSVMNAQGNRIIKTLVK